MTRKSETSIPGIYLITNTQTGTVYVGQAINIRKRWYAHTYSLNLQNHRHSYLQRAWTKYGAAAFAFSIHQNMSHINKDELSTALNEAEISLLETFPKTYNLMEAGVSGIIASEETRALLSKVFTERWANPEFREKRLLALTALHADPEYTERRLEAIKEARRTKESREKSSNHAKKLWADPEHKKKLSKYHADLWQDSEHRLMQTEARKKSWADPESRARRMAGLMVAAAKPEVLAARKAGIQKSAAKIGESHAKLWADPEHRAKMKAAQKAGWAAKKLREQGA